MRQRLCEHCLGAVEWRDADTFVIAHWSHKSDDERDLCGKVSTNPIPTLHVRAGAPDRQSMWDFERAVMVQTFEREHALLVQALTDVYTNAVHVNLPMDRWNEITRLLQEIGGIE